MLRFLRKPKLGKYDKFPKYPFRISDENERLTKSEKVEPFCKIMFASKWMEIAPSANQLIGNLRKSQINHETISNRYFVIVQDLTNKLLVGSNYF